MKHLALIAPSFPFPKAELERAKQYIKAQGMIPLVPENTLGEDPLCAHRDEVRLHHLQQALADPLVDIVWQLGGGYGMTRLLPSLFATARPEKEKLFLGYSDGTALHLFLTQVWHWPSLHGPVTRQLSEDRVGSLTQEMTLRVLKEGFGALSFPGLTPLNKPAAQLTALQGKVTGGNLSLVQCSLSTAWQIETKGKILFLEDAWERGYSIDRMLSHLQQARILEGVRAVILGDFIKGNEADGSSLIPAVLERFSETLEIPVFSLPGYGHGEENFPLPLNVDLNFLVKR